jgi:predicted MFS family arabinose efflux permease
MSLADPVRALPRAVWVVFVATFVNRCGTMALPFLALFLTDARHLDPRRAGIIFGIYGAGALVAGPAAGWLVARVGARTVMAWSLVGSAAALALRFHR